jgi:hypothetical protein
VLEPPAQRQAGFGEQAIRSVVIRRRERAVLERLAAEALQLQASGRCQLDLALDSAPLSHSPIVRESPGAASPGAVYRIITGW